MILAIVRRHRIYRSPNRSLICCVSVVVVLFACAQIILNIAKHEFRKRSMVTHLHILVRQWPILNTTTCGGNFTGYAQKFFRMKSTIYVPDTDSFQLACRGGQLPPLYTFIDNSYGVKKYISRISHMSETQDTALTQLDGVTVIDDRANAHNYFHMMQEWYNLFLISKFFSYDFRNMQLLLIDRSPDFQTDDHWKILFRKVIFARVLKFNVRFEDALFNIAGPGSPWYYSELDKPPYIEEFSNMILSSFGLVNNRPLDCGNFTITMYIRRDYYIHPGSDFLQKRNTQRKFKNENDLLEALKKGFPKDNIKTLLPEELSLREQLRLIVDTDILVGMHGCVFTNALFIHKHSAILEMYPKYWEIKHFFSDIARWRGIKYSYWRNEKKENEFQDHHTYVPPQDLLTNVNKMRLLIGCSL